MKFVLCFDNDKGNLVAYALDNHLQNTGNGKLDVIIENNLIDPKHVWSARDILEKMHIEHYRDKEFRRFEDSSEEFKETWPKVRAEFMGKYSAIVNPVKSTSNPSPEAASDEVNTPSLGF